MHLFFRKFFLGVELFFFFLKELWLSSIDVAQKILSPTLHVNPTIIKLPISLPSSSATVVLSNLISLTPGTLTLDVSEDQDYLWIHVLSLEDEKNFVRSFQEGFHKRVKDLFA